MAQAPGRCLQGGGGSKYFFSGPKFPPSIGERPKNVDATSDGPLLMAYLKRPFSMLTCGFLGPAKPSHEDIGPSDLDA